METSKKTPFIIYNGWEPTLPSFEVVVFSAGDDSTAWRQSLPMCTTELRRISSLVLAIFHLLSSSTWYLPSFIFYHLQLGTCHLVIFLTSLPRLLFLNTTKIISTSSSHWEGSSCPADTGHHFDNPVYSTFRASPSLCTTSTPLNNARLHNRSQEHGRGHVL